MKKLINNLKWKAFRWLAADLVGPNYNYGWISVPYKRSEIVRIQARKQTDNMDIHTFYYKDSLIRILEARACAEISTKIQDHINFKHVRFDDMMETTAELYIVKL